MCGIAGVLSRSARPLDTIQRMNDSQAHRGPDGAGVLLIDERAEPALHLNQTNTPDTPARLALGHRRLAILDTTDAGLQPMVSPDNTCWICFNGEVYNYRELKPELEALGHTFSTGTDTEVILAAWQAWGTDCFARFNGMWAIAIWDKPKRKLVLSRDRLGIKPLHIFRDGESLYFASEIKALLSTNTIQPEAEEEIVLAYLKYGMVNHHPSKTFFKNVEAFPPGHVVEIDWEQPTNWQSRPYWELEEVAEPFSGSMEEASDQFRELFESSINLRMRSDVPVGSCLSGGLDSSAIVCLANPHLDGAQFNTFTSASDDPRFDERAWSDLVNQQCNTRAHTVLPQQDAFMDDLSTLLHHQDEPFTTASIYAQYSIMREARNQQVPVLLDGQGADEALCGYRKFYLFYLRNLIQQKNPAAVLAAAWHLMRRGDRGVFRWWEGKRYLPAFLQKKTDAVADMIQPAALSAFQNFHLPLGAGTSVAARQITDIQQFSVPSLLRYEDRNSMAFSIESRVPFLDHRLIEFLISLPPELKLHRGQTKAVLRQSMRGAVPDRILDRRDKMGFVTPQQVWMRETLGAQMAERFGRSDLRLAKWVDSGKLAAAFTRFQSGSSDANYSEFFRLYLLDQWLEQYCVGG